MSNLVTRILLTLTIALVTGTTAAAEQSGAVVAEVGGQKITLGEFEQKEAGNLLQARYQYYLAERKVLEQLVDDELLKKEASRQNLTVEQLLDREGKSKVKDPTEDQIQVYYEGLNSNEPYETVRQKVLDHIREIRQNRALSAYMRGLHERESIHVTLAPPTAEVALGSAPLRGTRAAPVVMIEFADYQCPYCQKVHPELQKLQKEFGDRLVFAFKDFPLPMHSHAEKAAEAARCAGEQGKYWEYHDALFETKKLDVSDLKQQARTLKLDEKRFDECLDSSAQGGSVNADLDEAHRLGLTGTPSIFINGHFLSGAVDFNTLKDVIEQQLPTAPVTLRSAR
jgi:protein-disulfide isomerase